MHFLMYLILYSDFFLDQNTVMNNSSNIENNSDNGKYITELIPNKQYY